MKIRLIYSLLLISTTAFAGETGYKEPAQVELQAAAEAQSKTRDFTPSTEIADDAFESGDYETALKHYEALGEDGDSRASLAAGLIHAEGADGIDADKAKASAWFKRSSDQGGTKSADLYEKMDNKNELNEEDRAKAENLSREFQESDSKLTKDQQTLTTDSYSSGTYSPVSGIGSQQYPGKSELVQISDANIHTVSIDIEASFSPMRSNSGDYSFRPEKTLPSHYLPERE
jgi:TPR repeat protein